MPAIVESLGGGRCRYTPPADGALPVAVDPSTGRAVVLVVGTCRAGRDHQGERLAALFSAAPSESAVGSCCAEDL